MRSCQARRRRGAATSRGHRLTNAARASPTRMSASARSSVARRRSSSTAASRPSSGPLRATPSATSLPRHRSMAAARLAMAPAASPLASDRRPRSARSKKHTWSHSSGVASSRYPPLRACTATPSTPSSRRSRWAYVRRFATNDAGGSISQIASVRDAWLMVRPGFRTSITKSVREREAEMVIVLPGARTTTEPRSPYVHVIARLPV